MDKFFVEILGFFFKLKLDRKNILRKSYKIFLFFDYSYEKGEIIRREYKRFELDILIFRRKCNLDLI